MENETLVETRELILEKDGFGFRFPAGDVFETGESDQAFLAGVIDQCDDLDQFLRREVQRFAVWMTKLPMWVEPEEVKEYAARAFVAFSDEVARLARARTGADFSVTRVHGELYATAVVGGELARPRDPQLGGDELRSARLCVVARGLEDETQVELEERSRSRIANELDQAGGFCDVAARLRRSPMIAHAPSAHAAKNLSR